MSVFRGERVHDIREFPEIKELLDQIDQDLLAELDARVSAREYAAWYAVYVRANRSLLDALDGLFQSYFSRTASYKKKPKTCEQFAEDGFAVAADGGFRETKSILLLREAVDKL